MFLPIRNMSNLPTIRFKDPVNGNFFEISLQYPYKVNNGLLTKFDYIERHSGGITYYVSNEYGVKFYLPNNFSNVIHCAINLHNSIYNSGILSNEFDIIRNIENQSRKCAHSSGITTCNILLRRDNRSNRPDRYDCILYDSITNECFIHNSDGEVVGGTRIANMEPSIQRGHRAEISYPPFETDGCATLSISADEITNGHVSISNPNATSFSTHSYIERMNLYLSTARRPRTITFESAPINDTLQEYSASDEVIFKKDYIHPYNYIPEYIKHFMPGESEDTTLLLGIEVEVGGNDNVHCDNDKEPIVKKCIQIINGSDSDEEDLIYSTHDSTVQIEFDTMPCSLEFHKNKMNYRKMFEYLDKEGYKGHDCETAGLHIHANRSYLGKSRISQELVISKILYILEKFNDEICVIARRNNDYSQFAGEGPKEDSLVELYGKYKDKGKRAALNLQHKDTIEFRMFKSTLKYETFILTLEFVKDIIDYAKFVDIEEIELAKWSDLMDCFSPELRKYYELRYKKKVKSTNSLTIKQIRKRISKLKSELKNSKDFFQKAKLQQEISELEKKYKEINRKAKKVEQAKQRLVNFYDYI